MQSIILCTVFPTTSKGLEFYFKALNLLGYQLPSYSELGRTSLGRPYLVADYLPPLQDKTNSVQANLIKASSEQSRSIEKEEVTRSKSKLLALVTDYYPLLSTSDRETLVATLLALHQDYFLQDFNLTNSEEALAITWYFGRERKYQITLGCDLENLATFLPSPTLFQHKVVSPEDFYYPLALSYKEQAKLLQQSTAKSLTQDKAQITKIWTSKEALVKAYGSSIMRAKDLRYLSADHIDCSLFLQHIQEPILGVQRPLVNFTLGINNTGGQSSSPLSLQLAIFTRSPADLLLVQNFKPSLPASSTENDTENNTVSSIDFKALSLLDKEADSTAESESESALLKSALSTYKELTAHISKVSI